MYKRYAFLAVLGALLLPAFSNDADAALRRVAARTGAEVLPSPSDAPIFIESGVLPAGCCRPVCVKYRDKAHRRVCCDPCTPNIQTTIVVCDPCTRCPVAIDVCLPGCCLDCPRVTERCTIFGRGAITYCWDCGFSATFRFQRNGDVLVTYRS